VPHAVRFFDVHTLRQHYSDHNRDFGCVNEREYEKQAIKFLQADAAIIMALDCQGSDGDFVRYCPNSEEFAIVRPDGIIRTYFKPMPARLAQPGYPMDKTHGMRTNMDYFKESCK
jgi:pyocin large subunit-like protein